ncbi:MAG TPA: antibiotic hydrolase, partial [Chloroflexota bacterium]|nr:antibiotic hydrolase [Chloroflexota bacterium]
TPTTNQVATYSVPTQGGTPAGIIANANGTVWVSEYYGNTIDLLDPAKAVPSSQATIATSTGTATGADTPQHLSVGRAAVPTAHTVSASTTHVTPIQTTGWTQYPIPTAGANAEDMRVDRSGKVWFEEDSGKLGVLNPWASTITEWTVPTANSGWYNISLDPAGHLWFTEAANLVSSPPPAKIGVLVH